MGFSSARPPFSFAENGENKGIEIDIIKAVLADMGHTMSVTILPNARLLLALKNKTVDISASVQGKDGDGVFYSDTYIQYNNLVISRKVSGIKINSLKDMGKHSFVIWPGGYKDLGPAFYKMYKPDVKGKFKPNYESPSNQENQNLMFWLGRTELIVIDKSVFNWYRLVLAKKSIKTSDEVEFHDIFKTTTEFPAVFRDSALRDKFNISLAKIRSNGTYERIINSYK